MFRSSHTSSAEPLFCGVKLQIWRCLKRKTQKHAEQNCLGKKHEGLLIKHPCRVFVTSQSESVMLKHFFLIHKWPSQSKCTYDCSRCFWLRGLLLKKNKKHADGQPGEVVLSRQLRSENEKTLVDALTTVYAHSAVSSRIIWKCLQTIFVKT